MNDSIKIATLQTCLLIFLGLQSALVCADGINVRDVETHLDNEIYYLNAKLSCNFSDEAIEALDHGVAIHIMIDIKTKKQRDYLWDKTVSTSTIVYKIEYHPLSQRYVLTELNRLTRKDFQHLSNALDRLGDINDWPLINEKDIVEQDIYQVYIRARLDIQALPAPLRPLAFISNNWRLSSNWQHWDIKS